MKIASTIAAVWLIAGAALAQSVDLTTPDPIADELADVRLSFMGDRRAADTVLLLFGGASIATGSIVAGALSDQPLWLSFGLSTAVWGAINAVFALVSLDWYSDDPRTRIEQDRSLRGEALGRARERILRDQHSNGTLLAVNFGLDVLYVAGGLMLFFLADQLSQPEGDWLRGTALATTSQGSFLFFFDLLNWIASIGRADRVSRIPLVTQF